MNHPLIPVGRALSAVIVLALSFAVTRAAQENSLAIGVRSAVDGAAKKTSVPKDEAATAAGHGMKFGIFPAAEVPSGEKLVRPLDADTINGLYGVLQERLTARGFVGVQGKEKPDIVITVHYGRGFLPNPYREAKSQTATNALGSDPSAGLSGARMPTFLRIDPGRETKLQAANQEKLFFTIAAWEAGSMQRGKKPQRLWSTTINVDDPNHRDLGQIYPQMIIAGADYFNRTIDKEEVELTATVRDGRVVVGTPEVVPEPKPAK